LNIAKVWSEVGEVMESDVYDGHRKVIIEHTVYLLFFPDFLAPESIPTHSDPLRFSTNTSPYTSLTPTPGDTTPTSYQNPSSSLSLYSHANNHHHYTSQKHTLSSTARTLLSLCRRVALPVHTRLMFNDSGRVVHHQDVWDVKDIMRIMIPGMGAMQWVGSRLLANALSRGYGLYESISGGGGGGVHGGLKTIPSEMDEDEKLSLLESITVHGGVPASMHNALGLNLSTSERAAAIHSGRARAPDIDISVPSP